MKNVTYISDHIGTWIEKFHHYDAVNGTTLVAFMNDKTNEVDIVQTNDDGESITTHLSKDAAVTLLAGMGK